MRRVAASVARKRGPIPQPARKATSVFKSRPAPVGGWNARDPLPIMDPRDAVTLKNWFPRPLQVVFRSGFAEHETDFASDVKSIAGYTPPNTAARALFAASDDGVFDVTAGGSVGSAVATVTNGYINWVQMGVSGGHYLMGFNGVDKPVYWDGSSWVSVDAVSTPAITGVTTTELVSATIYKRRLILVQVDSASFWYLAVDSIGGAATEFLLGPLCKKGGYLMAVGTWSLDAGNGPDDYMVCVTSEGEAIVFTGTDPGDTDSWSLVGVYDIGRPLGRKCLQKYGGDLVVMTEQGVLPLSATVQKGTVDYRYALTDKIKKAFVEAAAAGKTLEGWQAVVYPTESAFVFNVPVTAASEFEQYVMNTTTKAWGQFTDWDVSCLEEYGGALYGGLGTSVVQLWTGTSDNGTNIIAEAQTAYDYFGDRGLAKDFVHYRPQLLVSGTLDFTIGLSVDFEQLATLTAASYSVVSGAVWDAGNWDDAYWASGLEIVNDWRTPAARPGYCASMLLKVTNMSLEIQWAANDYIYQKAGAFV